MAPRRAAAVSAASSISQAAGPSTSLQANVPKNSPKQGRQSSGGQQQTLGPAKTPTVIPIVPVQPLSPIVIRLRKMWKFAAICQFLFTFDEAFGMSGFETEALENDLDGSEKKVIPDLMRRLLYTLTLNRNIDEYNWEDHLRAQYLARHPEETLLGTIEEPFPWSGLPLWQKVDTLHQACEWQLWDAERFRKLVKNEEEAHVWRIDPIGWDSKDNTYWLFDDNRLWIQYPRPAPVKAKAPPKKNSKKAKMEAAAAKRAAQKSQSQSQKRKREDFKPKSTPTRASTRNRVESVAMESPAQKRGKSSRRSTAVKDDWEEIPPELLYEGDVSGVAEEGDEESDLSDPPPADDEDISMAGDVKEENGEDFIAAEDITMDVKEEDDRLEVNGKDEGQEAEEAEEEVGEKVKTVEEEASDDWIEFETIAVTRQDWEAISVQFAKSKHPDEKSFYQLLKSEVMPKVMADLEEAERQRQHEAAMANRKRSSRIALKESEREEKERDRVARLKMEEKMATIRADEERQRIRDREEKNSAQIREERLREREDRMAAREREAFERAEKEIMERENREKMREMRKMKREQIIANGGMINESEELQQSKADDEDSWELNCEVCGSAGINPEDTAEIVCCETCGRWQHTECWNSFDRKVGREGRNWEMEDFFCSTCKPPAPGQPWPRPANKQEHTTMQGSARTPQSNPSVSSPYHIAQPVAVAAATAPPPPQRPISVPETPHVYSNYNVRPSMSSPNGQGQQYHQSQQQQYYAQQQPQSTYSSQQQMQQQPVQHPYHSIQSMQKQPHSQQQMLQAMYSQAPSYQPFYSSQAQSLQHHQQQPSQPQMSAYSPSTQGYSNGHSHISQAPLRSPSFPQGQNSPQHMQRPSPVQSPSSNWPKPSGGSRSHATFDDSGRDMHAPSPTSHSQVVRPFANHPSPQAHSASQARPIAKHPSPQAPIASLARPVANHPSPQAPIASPTRPIAALPSPQASIAPPVRPAQLLSNPFASLVSPAQPEAVVSKAQIVNASLARPVSAVSSPQAPNTLSSLVPVSPSSMRSPSPSAKATTSGVPRNIASLPSGSFPLRRNSTAKSPLSRPEGYTSPSIPTMNLGPTIGRAVSPSPLNKSPTSNTKMDPLYHRQTVLSTIGTTPASEGPGPSSGSLARARQSSNPSQMTSVATSPSQAKPDASLQQQAKILGPSPPRPVFGGVVSSTLPQNNTIPPPMQNTAITTQSNAPSLSSSSSPPPPQVTHQGNSQS